MSNHEEMAPELNCVRCRGGSGSARLQTNHEIEMHSFEPDAARARASQ